MPTYKVIYLNYKVIAEPLRFLMSYGDIVFEDIRVARVDWPALKPAMPMGQMPVLEIDGKALYKTVSIARYLAKQIGLGGKDDWENLQIDIAVDTVNDLREKISVAVKEDDEEVKAKKMEIIKNETVPFYVEKLEAFAKENNGHLALRKLTWADLYFAAVIDGINFMIEGNLTEKSPNLQKVIDNVMGIEQIKKWVAKRPEIVF